MRFSLVTGLVAASLVPTLAHPHATAPDVIDDVSANATHAFDKRQTSFYLVEGAPGNTQPRYELRELAQRPNEWNIFLLALRNMHDRTQAGSKGYYQIAGIHGMPRQDWDSVGRCAGCDDAVGYCPHDSILFLGWHRAYLALFEQRLIEIAGEIAPRYPSGSRRSEMVAAARNLRLPYWDWAARPESGSTFPDLFTSYRIAVDGPDGETTIPNPLFRHDFTDASPLEYTPFASMGWTYRYPSANNAQATSSQSSAQRALDNIRSNLQDQLYQMFATCDEFIEVASDAQGQSSSRCSNSLEGIHNTVHVALGGLGSNGITGGHMTYLPVASFEPAFWLHHTNVDRLWAMWQTVHPDAWGGSQTATSGTWTVASGSTQDTSSPLTPFHRNAAGTFWTTDAVRDWTLFKYTYPEYERTAGTRSAIQTVINTLYGPDASGFVKRNVVGLPPPSFTADASLPASSIEAAADPQTKASADPQTESADCYCSDLHTAAPGATLAAPLEVASNGSLWQYVANVHTPRYALGASYWIYLFHIGPTNPDDVSTFLTDPALIGPVGVLADDLMPAHHDTTAAYSIPLTRPLTAAVNAQVLTTLAPAHVRHYLRTNLVWRIVDANGNEVEPADLPGFAIGVFQSTATVPADGELPEWSEFVPLTDVTGGKSGGVEGGALRGEEGGDAAGGAPPPYESEGPH